MSYQKLQASSAAVVTKSDTVNIVPASGSTTPIPSVLYVGTGGSVRVLTAGGDDVTFVNILSGSFIPVNVIRVFSTGTSASDMLALW